MCFLSKTDDSKPGKKCAIFRFYEELNNFLPKSERKKEQKYYFWGNPSVKDAIEALGIPHSEIEIILVNSVSVGFDYRLQAGDRISVYPVFESIDVTPLIRLKPAPMRSIRFMVDGNLAKLARWLRLLGFDACCEMKIMKSEFVKKALAEKRIILTSDKNLLKRKEVTHGYYVREKQMHLQLREILARFDLHRQVKPFTRCMSCNGLLKNVAKRAVENLIPEKVYASHDEFKQCPNCEKVYWKGSHYDKMGRQIINVTG